MITRYVSFLEVKTKSTFRNELFLTSKKSIEFSKVGCRSPFRRPVSWPSTFYPVHDSFVTIASTLETSYFREIMYLYFRWHLVSVMGYVSWLPYWPRQLSWDYYCNNGCIHISKPLFLMHYFETVLDLHPFLILKRLKNLGWRIVQNGTRLVNKITRRNADNNVCIFSFHHSSNQVR